jgi:hypothetical protein
MGGSNSGDGSATAVEKETVNAVAVEAAEDEDDPRRSRDLRSGDGRTKEFVQVVLKDTVKAKEMLNNKLDKWLKVPSLSSSCSVFCRVNPLFLYSFPRLHLLCRSASRWLLSGEMLDNMMALTTALEASAGVGVMTRPVVVAAAAAAATTTGPEMKEEEMEAFTL